MKKRVGTHLIKSCAAPWHTPGHPHGAGKAGLKISAKSQSDSPQGQLTQWSLSAMALVMRAGLASTDKYKHDCFQAQRTRLVLAPTPGGCDVKKVE